MEGYRLLWGDFHTHLVDLEHGDDILRAARRNIDFYAVLCYPFVWDTVKGLRLESVGQRPEFRRWWDELTRLAARHDARGSFTTFLGYEWHGDRTRWGDHNVIYRDAVGELDPARDLPELYARLRGTPALVIPHHTAYHAGSRAKDWNTWDRALSPVMELYSCHGSSEGTDTPLSMTSNCDMGPRSAGNGFQDALARGIRVGVIGSNDSAGLPGRWGLGRAAVWARDCTRRDIFDAVVARRTYAVTGDRIVLDFSVAGVPMGSEGHASGRVVARASVVGSHAIDRVELLHDGVVARTHCHSGRWERDASAGRFKCRLCVGWGPVATFGYDPPPFWAWDGFCALEGGTFVGVEQCIDRPGQSVSLQTRRCDWHLETAGRRTHAPFGMVQGLVFEIDGSPQTRLHLEVEGRTFDTTLAQLREAPLLLPLLAESQRRAVETFSLSPGDVENPDTWFHNARKIKLHRAVPESAWRTDVAFDDLQLHPGPNDFYLRVSQTNGQHAWSSPVWIDCP